MTQFLIEGFEGEPRPCIVCNFEYEWLFVLVPKGSDAVQFYNQNGGVCAEDLLVHLMEQETEAQLEVSNYRGRLSLA